MPQKKILQRIALFFAGMSCALSLTACNCPTTDKPLQVTCDCASSASDKAQCPQAQSPTQNADASPKNDAANKGQNGMNTAFDKENVFRKGSLNEAYAQYFIGNSYLNPLTDSAAPIPMSNVTFEPGTRNNWHIHQATSGGGQMLICTAGEGWYQEQGKPPVSLKPGMVINIPAGVNHWHGAKANSWFSHIAISVPGENTKTDWLNPVTDEEYAKLPLAENPAQIAPKVTAGRDALGEFAPKFAQLNDDVLFGEVWARQDKLSTRDRSLITVTSLVSSGIFDSSLEHHIRNAKNNGVTAQEMAEALTQLAFYAGWPKAWAAFRLAKNIYAE